MSRASIAFEELLSLMDRLRSPGGCVWDGEQTHASLVRYLIEESYEVVEAIEDPRGIDRDLLREELGDVLLQVVFHARIAEEGGEPFDVADVIEGLNAKLVRRHPHVFGSGNESGEDEAASAGEVTETRLEDLTRSWDAIKREEKPERAGPFDGIPPALPALSLAEKTVGKAAKASLPLPQPVNLVNEPDRGGGAVSPESVRAAGHEAEEAALGRALLGVVAHCREIGVDPEKALRRAVREYVAASEAGEPS